MGKKQRDNRKAGVQLEPRRPSVGWSTSASLASRPTNRVTIGQVVESSHDVGFEQHLPDNLMPHTDSGSYFESIQIDPEGCAVVSPMYSHVAAGGERFTRRDSNEKGSFIPHPSDSGKIHSRCRSKKWAYKNVYGLSLAYVVLFTAYIGLLNLQSSINSAGGLGLVTLSLLYATFLAAGFVTPGFLKLFGTKYSLLFGFICHFIYTLTNYYPSWYTLVPASILIGFASAPIWAAANTHLAEVAIMVAPGLGKKQDYLISKFTGMFFFFFQFSQVPGNLASSLILFPYNEDVAIDLDTNSNDSYYEGEACNILTGQSFDIKYLYMLVSIYVGFIITSIVLLLIFVDRLPTNNNFFSTEKKFQLYLKEPLIELLKVLKDRKMLLLAPVIIYSGMELAFASGSFTEFYISQCFGTYQIGFTLIVFGISSSIMSIVYSRLVKCVPRLAIVLFGMALSAAMLLFMLFWERVPSYSVIFTIAAGWGAAEAMWHTIPTSLTGILFSSCSDVAYSAMRIWQAGGLMIGFATAKLLSFHHRVWVLLATVILAAVVSLIIEFTTQSREELLPCVYRKRDLKMQENSESNSETKEGNNTPKLDTSKGPVDCELTQDHHNGVGQNPIFIMYSGRRPSAMSTWSADSLDGALPSTSTNSVTTDGRTLLHQQNGQNPIFVMYNGRRPSTDSINSYKQNKGMSGNSRRPSAVSTLSADSLDGTRSLLASSNSNTQTAPYPPLMITTVTCMSSDMPIQVLSPIHECEDDNKEHPTIIRDSSKISIQRSRSYMAALNDAVNTKYSHC